MKIKILWGGLPLLLSSVSGGLLHLLSLYVLSTLYGREVVSGFGLGSHLLLTYIGVLSGIGAGSTSYFALRMKKKEPPALSSPVFAAAILSVLILLVSEPIKSLYLSFAHIKGGNLEVAHAYLAIVMWSLPLIAVGTVLSSYLIFQGKNWSLLLLTLLSMLFTLSGILVVRIGLTPPLLGIQTIALFSLMGSAAFLILVHIYIHENLESIRSLYLVPWSRKTVGYVFRHSLYAGGQVLLIVTSLSALVALSARISCEAVAVMSALLAINRFFILPFKAFGASVGAMASQQYAVGQPQQASAILRNAIGLLSYFVAPIGFLMIAFPSFVLDLFFNNLDWTGNDAASVQVAGIALLCEPVAGFLSTALKTQGMNRSVFFCTLYQWIIAIPLAWFFGIHLGYGLLAIWWSILSFRVIFGLCCLVIWQRYNRCQLGELEPKRGIGEAR